MSALDELISRSSSRANILGSSALTSYHRLTSLLGPTGQVPPSPQGGALHTPQASTWLQTLTKSACASVAGGHLHGEGLCLLRHRTPGAHQAHHKVAWHTEIVERKFGVEGSLQHLQSSPPSSRLRPGCRRGTMTCSRQHFCEYSLAFLVCLIPAEEKDSPVGFESFNLGMTSFFLPPPPQQPLPGRASSGARSQSTEPHRQVPGDFLGQTASLKAWLGAAGCGLVNPKDMCLGCTVPFVWLGLGAR